MMYFSPLKTWLILGAIALGALLCIPNALPAPASWVPWRTVHLGLDLQGGSYLLLEVDMRAVIKERLESWVDAVRQDLRPKNIFYQTLAAQPDQNRVLLRVRDPARLGDALDALKPLVQQTGPTGQPELQLASNPQGEITLTLSPPELIARANAAVQQSIEIVRRRVDES
ncbi:MAG: protein translocase subunit SecD, partial [Acetobacteraceae bacterium]|nr:protein translocase subunit SecD [Acetobacteraceae bacterium]